MKKKYFIFYTLIIALFLTGCGSSYQEKLSSAKSLTKVVTSSLDTVKENTPEDDYILGLKIAPTIIHQPIYKPTHPRVKYVNNIVQTLKRFSKKPYLYNGYKVVLLKDSSFNAYALPGGIIVMHDGVFKYTYNEEELAAILAHEIGHIENNHFLKDAKVEDMNTMLSFAVKKETKGESTAILNTLLSGMKNKIFNGYSVEQEAEADQTSIRILNNAGYETKALGDVLSKLKKRTNSYGGANYPKDRIALLEKNKMYSKTFINLQNKKLREKRFDVQKYERY